MSSGLMNLWQKNNKNENWFREVPIILIFHIESIRHAKQFIKSVLPYPYLINLYKLLSKILVTLFT